MATLIGKTQHDIKRGEFMVQRFYNNTGNSKVGEAIIIAEGLLTPNSKMIEAIKNKKDFKYDSGNGSYIASELLEARPIVRINFYRSKWPWSAAIGYVNSNDSKNMYLNSRKIEALTISDIVGWVLHEWSHLQGFHHGTGRTANYKTEDKCLYSVPYYLSENVSKWFTISK
jgi:hypothetical protein